MSDSMTGRIPQGGMVLLDTRIDNIDGRTALERVLSYAKNGNGAHSVYFTNVHTIHIARREPELLRALNAADLVLPDGSGLKIAGKIIRSPIIENLNGTDFTPRVLEHAASEGRSVYLLGGTAKAVNLARERLVSQIPSLKIVGCRSGYFSPEEESLILREINERRPDILLVAFGTPLQEQWIARHAPILKVGVCMAVGGLFDFLSGEKSRAPRWIRSCGFEFMYRFLQDPRSKWERIFVEIPLFLALILKRRFLANGSR